MDTQIYSQLQFFQENRQRFEKFLDKIIHVVLEERIETDDPWVRENYQRNHCGGQQEKTITHLCTVMNADKENTQDRRKCKQVFGKQNPPISL